ncbi:MAG: MerR family transcriptional regulator [Bacteroidales bacterium]|nr:MerR family transcriptional regulator [Bacteroidales bacterium]MBQ6578721.1 MerR family transcriptional regulator [Bacteroidales bacterium]
MEKIYYSIGEVSEILGESTSLVRFWTNTFERFLKPKRNSRGNRVYTNEDIETLKQLHLLIKSRGMTLDGAAQYLAQERKKVEGRVKALNSLREIRTQLDEIRRSL